MRNLHDSLAQFLIIVACCAGGAVSDCAIAPALAQPADNPFIEDPPADDAMPADEAMAAEEGEPQEAAIDAGGAMEAGDVFGADEPEPAAAPPAAAAPVETAPEIPNDPAVLAVVESHPKTPAELVRAIGILVDLGQAASAQSFADQLVKTQLDQKAKAELVAQAHPATLLKLAHHAELGGALAPFIDDALKSAEAYRRDPARLVEAAARLSDPNEVLRAHAAITLLGGGEASVAPLVAMLADPARADLRPAATTVLVHLRGLAVPPLLGVLESPDAALKTEVIEVLGTIGTSQAVGQLLGPYLSPSSPAPLRAAAASALAKITGATPPPGEALAMLERAARRPLEQSVGESDDFTAPMRVWHWNARKNESMPIQYDAPGAALAESVRLARDLYMLDPQNGAHRQLYVLSMLQAAKFRAGLDKPLATGEGTAFAIVARQGPDAVDGLLSTAMAEELLPAATAAAQILGEIGSAELLTRTGAEPSPLARAVAHSDRRLSFAALEAIMNLKPTEPFAGSSKVVDALAFFASSFGTARVLVAHPRSAEGRQIAGLAAALGYEGDVATNGRWAYELATGSPDYEFVLIHSAILRPGADELLNQLRRNGRTALLPVGFIAPLDDLDRVRRFAAKLPRAEAFLQPQNEAEMKLFTARVLARATRSHVSHQERMAQATAALDWLVDLATTQSRVFDVRSTEPAIIGALYAPELSSRAAVVLGELGSPRAQQALLELADAATQPAAARQAAAAAFAVSITRHGLGIGRDEILRQYDLYNTNAARDTATHQVLTTILDAIEGRVAKP